MTHFLLGLAGNSSILLAMIVVLLIPSYCLQFGLRTRGPKHTSGTDNTNVTMTLYWKDLRYQCNVHPNGLNTSYLCDTYNDTTRECDGASNPIQYGLQIGNNHHDALQIDQVIIKDIDNQTDDIIVDYFCFNISNVAQIDADGYDPLTDQCLCALHGGYDYIRIDSDHFVPFQLIIIDQLSITSHEGFVYNTSTESCIDTVTSNESDISHMYDMDASLKCTKYPTSAPTLAATLEPISMEPRIIIVIIVISVILIVISVMIILTYYKHKRKQKYDSISTESDMDQIQISNALVVLIGIGEYEEYNDVNNSDIGNYKLQNIPIDKDLNNLRELFNLLNYTIIPDDDNRDKWRDKWSENEIMSLLKDEVGNELIDNNDKVRYDGLIVCITCHGIPNHIITSDLKAIEKPVIHRLISLNYPSVRDIPRIFIFDTCDGDAINTKDNTNDNEKGKYVKLTDIAITKPWQDDDKNPDYQLVDIRAANIGFQAKYNVKIGSYLLTEFSRQMKESIMHNQSVKLGEIFDKIQNRLHDQGKQQPVATFNNNTRNLVFKRNKL